MEMFHVSFTQFPPFYITIVQYQKEEIDIDTLCVYGFMLFYQVVYVTTATFKITELFNYYKNITHSTPL